MRFQGPVASRAQAQSSARSTVGQPPTPWLAAGGVCSGHSFLLQPHREARGAAELSSERPVPLPGAQLPPTPTHPRHQLGGGGSSPTAACSLGRGRPVPSAPSSIGPATGAVVGKYSAATHRPRGPRRPTWCRRWAGSRPPACRDAQSRQWLSPTWWGLGLPGLLRVQSPGSVPPQPAQRPPHAGLGR